MLATHRILAAALAAFGLLIGSAHADLAEAQSMLSSGDFRAALMSAQKSIPSQPVEAYTLRAKAFEGLKEFEMAIGQAQRGLSHNPENRDLIIYLGDLLAQRGFDDQAVDFYHKAHTQVPSDYPTLVRYIELLDRVGRLDVIITDGTNALTSITDPASRSNLYERLSKVYERQENWAKAADTASKSLDGATASVLQEKRLGEMYMKARNWPAAINTLQSANEKWRKNDEIVFLLARSLWNAGQKDSACDLYAQLIEDESELTSQISGEEWRETQKKRTPMAVVLHEKYGLAPFLIGGASVLLLAIIAGLLYLRRLKD